MADLTRGVAALSRDIAEGAVDPVTLTEAALDRIAAHPLADRIFARTTTDRARAEAAAAAHRARHGVRRDPMDGVPLSWKDLFDSAGTATEAGSALLSGRTPARDAAVLARATAAGAVCLGKTHMSELAFAGLGLNPVTGTPPCVNDPGAVAGGSSSGAAASVAFGLAAGAVGSDTGGSVRVPAAWNDLVGLKSGHGSLPMDGVVPLCPSFDTIGPLARSVVDAALLWAMLSGRRAPDLAGAAAGGLYLARLETVAMDDLDPGVATAYDAALDRLIASGARITALDSPAVAEAMPLSATLFAPEAYGIWRDTIEAAPDRMFPPVRERFRGGADVPAPDFAAAWHRLRSLRRDFAAAGAGFDAVILPTCPILPPKHDRLLSDADYYTEKNLMTLRNTRVGNLMGSVSVTLPAGAPSVGLMLLTPPGTEARALRIAAALEAALA